MYVATFESADPSNAQWLRAVIVHDGKRYVGPTFESKTTAKGKAETPEQIKAGRTLWAMIGNMAIRR